MTWQVIVLIVWAAVAIIGGGIYYEVDECSSDDIFDIVFGAGFWPVMLVVLLGIGALWCLSWVGRGPGKLVKWLLNRDWSRSDLPEAKVVKE